MSRPSWLVDPSRIATKIRSASGAVNPTEVQWKSNPSKCCPNCNYVMDNDDVSHAWPGLPRGVKFDPTDQEIVWHLLAKVGTRNFKPHPFIDEFIPTVDEEDGICYTHPQNLPGVNQDGTVSHFFFFFFKAYSTGTRKRRKINGDNSGDVRWHKTGRTKPVLLDGVQRGCNKIMVLYISPVKGGKSEKTNWVMHQYHLGTGEDEKEGEYVISKVFYQQQQVKQTDKGEEDISEAIIHSDVVKVDPFTPKSVTPEPPRLERRFSNHEAVQDSTIPLAVDQHHENIMDDEIDTLIEQIKEEDYNIAGKHTDEELAEKSDEGEDDGENKWLEENESQIWLTSQQLVEGLSLCEDFLRSQSPSRDESGGSEQVQKGKALLSDYARLGPEDLKRDLEECRRNMALDHADVHLGTPSDLKRELEDCQNMSLDPANIDLDTPPDFRLSQLEFESEDSYVAWGGSILGGKGND